MSKPIEITYDSFETEVVQSDIPVILDFWAPWCGPCRNIAPILDKFAVEYEGKVKVGKVNVDNEQQLAMAFNVQGIPMLVAMKGNDVLGVEHGFRGEGAVKKLFDQVAG